VVETALHKHRMERALQERESWLSAILKSIGDGVVATDEDRRIMYLNPVAEQLTGWTDDEAAGHTLEEVFKLVHEETREPMEVPLAQAMREQTVVPLANHALLIAKDHTERPVADCASPILDEGGAVVGGVLVFRDVTERKLRESLRLEVALHERMGEEL